MGTPEARNNTLSFLPRQAAPARKGGAIVFLPLVLLLLSGCVHPAFPQLDREERILEALERRDAAPPPPSPLSPEQAVCYALQHNLDSRVAQLEAAYQNENLAAAGRRLLPSLTGRYAFDHTSRPAARWSQSVTTGEESLGSSFSSQRDTSRSDVGLLWSLLDFGVGYLKARQQAERVHSALLHHDRVRQQVALETLSAYWRAAFTAGVASDAEALRKELESHAEGIRDAVDMRILSGAEGARRELAVYSGLAEIEQWTRAAVAAKLELARVMGCGGDFRLREFPNEAPGLPAGAPDDPVALQEAALRRRPELYQADAQERIALDDARMALLQMAPNASLSFSLYDDPDKFLEYNNWMTAGARASWNLFAIPARLSERRAARLQGDVARERGLALAAAVMAQVGIAWSDWRLAHEHAESLYRRAGARGRLVAALAAGEEGGQASAGEVLQERVRLLSECAAAMRAGAEVMIAGARLANAAGVAIDDKGCFVWRLSDAATAGAGAEGEEAAARMFPGRVGGVPVAKAEKFRDAGAPAPGKDGRSAGASAAGRGDGEAERRRAEAEQERIARDLERERRGREERAREERERRRERLLRGRGENGSQE